MSGYDPAPAAIPSYLPHALVHAIRSTSVVPNPIFPLFLGMLFLQWISFTLCWDFAVLLADSQGRTLRGGIGSGLLFFYGSMLHVVACFLASLVTIQRLSASVRWTALAVCNLLWILPGWICLNQFPIRMPVFLLLGTFILVGGSGILLPFFARLIRNRRNP